MCTIRKLALHLLDEQNGISAKAYDELKKLLEIEEATEIVDAVVSCNGRVAFANEDFAEEELKKLAEVEAEFEAAVQDAWATEDTEKWEN